MGSVRPGLFKANFGLGNSSLRPAMKPDEVEMCPHTLIRPDGVSPTKGLPPNLNGPGPLHPWRLGPVRDRPGPISDRL